MYFNCCLHCFAKSLIAGGRGRPRGCTILAGTGRGSEENENVRSPYALRSKRNFN